MLHVHVVVVNTNLLEWETFTARLTFAYTAMIQICSKTKNSIFSDEKTQDNEHTRGIVVRLFITKLSL